MINTIISSSILILMVIAIRFLFKGRINPLLQYGLWGLVTLRLVVFSWLNIHPIESVLSVMNIVSKAEETMRGASAVDQVIAGNASAKIIDNAVLILDNVRTGVVTSGDGISTAAAIDWQLILMIIWAIGTIVFCIGLIFVNRRFGNMIIKNRKFLMPISVNKKRKTLPVYVVEGLDSPCILGYKGEEAIYVTSEVALDEEKLHYAITHELCHYKHNDLIWSVVRVGLLAFYWFNPLVWIAAIMSKRDCELACDYGVIKELGEEYRIIYGETLMDLISLREHKPNVFCTATTMYGSSKGIKERIVWIAKKRKMRIATLVTVILLAILAVVGTFTEATNSSNDLDNMEKTNNTVIITTDVNSYSPMMSSGSGGIKMTPVFNSKNAYTKLEYHWITDEGEFISSFSHLGKEVNNQGETVLWSAVENDKVIDIKSSFEIRLEVIDGVSKKILANTKLTIKPNEIFYEVEKQN